MPEGRTWLLLARGGRVWMIELTYNKMRTPSWFMLSLFTLALGAEPTKEPEGADPAQRAALFADATKRAEAGDPEAMLDLALDHLLGFGTSIDKARGAEWMRRAAESGNARAYFMYGQICQRGEIRPKDLKEALRWFRLAAANQNADAELSLALCYESGKGVEVDAKEARRWLELSAAHGHPIAQESLALALGGTSETAKARQANEWLRKSAMQGNASASIRLGVNHILARGTTKNVALGLAWISVGEMMGDDEDRAAAKEFKRGADVQDLTKARSIAKGIADKIEFHPIYASGPQWLAANRAFKAQFELAQGGKAEDQYQLAGMYHAGYGTLADPDEAAKWCRKAAEQGHVEAMNSLAASYRDGDGVPVDEREMLAWYRKAATLGDANAQLSVSDYLLNRGNVPANLTEAEFWLRKSAAQGQPVAQGNLGSLLMQTGVADKQPEAVRWFKLSAAQGHPKGMFKYGLMLILGNGVAKNEVEGAAWMIACDPKDDEGLRTAIKEVLGHVSAETRTKAEAAAVEIRKLF